MSKSAIEILADELRKNPEYIKHFNEMAKLAAELEPLVTAVQKAKLAQDPEPEIHIIEQSAIPAGYFMRPSVQEAVLAEITKDYKATGQIAPGAELIGQEEESDGETKEISSPEDDSVFGGAGSEPSQDGSDNGSSASGSGEDNNRQPDPEHSDSGSEKSQKPSGEK